MGTEDLHREDRLKRLDRVNNRLDDQERAGRYSRAQAIKIVQRWIRRYYLR